MKVTKKSKVPSYNEEKEKLREFLIQYTITDVEQNTIHKYVHQLIDMSNGEQRAMYIEMGDIEDYDVELHSRVIKNTKRYIALLYEIVDDLLPKYRTKKVVPRDTLDRCNEHRLLMEKRLRELDKGIRHPKNMFPPELLRRFEIYFTRKSDKRWPIRKIKAKRVGQLVVVKGMVARCSEVKPLICVANYRCNSCHAETYQPVGGIAFNPLDVCDSDQCRTSKTPGRLLLYNEGSKFIKFREITLQEPSDEVPAGHVPRSVNIYCRGENAVVVHPGDYVLVTGVFLPLIRHGYDQRAHYVLSDYFFDAHHVEIVSKTAALAKLDFDSNFTESELEEIEAGDIYNKLSSSLAPEVYGNEDVKKALLLLLVGGVEKKECDVNIRGNIHMCIMGDPGVAKSRLLSSIDKIAAKSQYTTGRGLSGVGLTATVVKDPVTGEVMLESGALVLADKGVCCIDEFDKISDEDKAAIHEIMEQQTASIAKAGINTSLSAEVSILAAANPAYGRYNTKKSIEFNIRLPVALLSRFDLIWLIKDQPDRQYDLELARHITSVHRNDDAPQTNAGTVSVNFFKRFVAKCRTINPVIPRELGDYIVRNYVEMRKKARSTKDKTFTSPRNLLGVIRLATALARLRFADVVLKEDVQEAIRLIEKSKESIMTELQEGEMSVIDRIYDLIIDCLRDDSKPIKMIDIISVCTARGFRLNEINECIEEYEQLNVWAVDQTRTTLTFL